MLKKLSQRLSDPVFYRKRFRQLTRPFRRNQIIGAESHSLSELDLKDVLLVIAHPDDEVFCSGLLCELNSLGANTRIACLTRGEGGPLIDGITREELPVIRESEMEKSCAVLGVNDLTFLDVIDPTGSEFRTFAPDISVNDLAAKIDSLPDPGLIIAHGSGGEYWHPAHLLVHQVAKRVASEKRKQFLTFNAADEQHPIPSIINHDDPAHIRLETSIHQEARIRSLEAHHSQLGVFANFAAGTHLDFIEKTQRESLSLAQY